MAEEVEEIEITEEEPAVSGGPLLGSLRRLLLAGVGAVSLAQDEIDDFVNKLVERGEIAEKDGRQLMRDIRARRHQKAQEAEERLEKRLEGLMDRMNIPSRKDVETLSDKISKLAEKVDELMARE
jgi:poly(hydroxyalkanoate) granule-associated protein